MTPGVSDDRSIFILKHTTSGSMSSVGPWAVASPSISDLKRRMNLRTGKLGKYVAVCARNPQVSVSWKEGTEPAVHKTWA